MSSVIVSRTKNKNIYFTISVDCVENKYLCICLCEIYHMAMQDYIYVHNIEYSTGKKSLNYVVKKNILTFSYENFHSMNIKTWEISVT